jgi:hypothetical protein
MQGKNDSFMNSWMYWGVRNHSGMVANPRQVWAILQFVAATRFFVGKLKKTNCQFWLKLLLKSSQKLSKTIPYHREHGLRHKNFENRPIFGRSLLNFLKSEVNSPNSVNVTSTVPIFKNVNEISKNWPIFKFFVSIPMLLGLRNRGVSERLGHPIRLGCLFHPDPLY